MKWTMKWSCMLLSGFVSAVFTAAAFAQVTPAMAQARGAEPTIFINGPRAERATLSYSASAGWRLRSGWQAADSSGAVRSSRPLTVYMDGPTGYVFVYMLNDGWKFVGTIADSGD